MVRAVKDGAAQPLRVGVVGVGVMGANHARVFSGLPDVTLVGVADPSGQQRELVTRILGVPAVDHIDALLGPGLDAVTIAAPTHLHHEIALKCIDARHPRAGRKADRLQCRGRPRDHRRRAQRRGVTLMVGHVERFNPAVQAIKEAIQDEDILSIGITRVGPFPPRMSNVGVVIDLAVHDIDLIRWFTDSEIVEVQPQISSAVAEREDIALLQFRTASGVLAHINTNWLTPFKARTVHVATRRKYLIGDLLTRQVSECFGFQPDGSYSMRHLSVGHAEPLRAELQAFVSAVRDGKTPAVSGEEGVESLGHCDALSRRPPARERGAATSRSAPRRRLIAFVHARPVCEANESARPHRQSPIPFIDVAAQRRRLGKAIDEAVARVLTHCQFLMGPEVAPFETAARGLLRRASTLFPAPAAPMRW